MVYLFNMVIFHGYVSHNQRVYVYASHFFFPGTGNVVLCWNDHEWSIDIEFYRSFWTNHSKLKLQFAGIWAFLGVYALVIFGGTSDISYFFLVRQSLIGSSVAAIIGVSNNDWIQVQSGDIRLKLSFHTFGDRWTQMGVSKVMGVSPIIIYR